MKHATTIHLLTLPCAVALAAAGTTAVLAGELKSLEPVEVTGTRIKRVDRETPAPVQILTAEEIRRSGAVSIDEALRRLPASSSGDIHDLHSIYGFSDGASTVSLRGLGSHATLTLLNGRRITASPYADPTPGQSQIYNLNAIPLAAVERIEVLKSGASAIYGSDAMAGVVNIVLRKDYRGAEAGAGYSKNHEGEFGNRQAWGFIGFGDADGGFNGQLMMSDTRRSAVNLGDTRNIHGSELTRLFGRDTLDTGIAYPGNHYRESVAGSGVFDEFVARDARCPAELVMPDGRCGFNRDAAGNLVDAQESNAFSARASLDIGRNLALFGEFGFSRVTGRFAGVAPGISQNGSTWFTPDGQRRFFQLVLPAGHPDNPASEPVAMAYRFGDLGAGGGRVTTDTGRLLLGVKGNHAGWEWESALMHMAIERDTVDSGVLHATALAEAIATQAYRPFGNNSAATLAVISPRIRETGQSANTSWDLKGTRELTRLADGPLSLAAGVEWRHERLDMKQDARVAAGDIIGFGTLTASGSRRLQSLFAELSAPVMKNLETQLALRSDHYSDYGNSTTPQFGVKWKPMDMLALRASHARGFRAPPLATIGNASLQLFNFGLSDPLRCGAPGGADEDCAFSVSSILHGNPDLKPERSDSQTIGLVFSPTADLDVAVDVYRINRINEVDHLRTDFVLQNETLFPGAVIRNPNPASWLPGVPDSGPIQGMRRKYLNLGRTITRGIDIDASLRHSFDALGKLKLQFSGTYLLKFKSRLRDGEPYVESQGAYGPAGELPRFKGSLSATWTWSGYALTATVNHVSGWFFGDSLNGCYEWNPDYLDAYNCRVRPWTTVDLHLAYSRIRSMEFGFGVRNLRNRKAPVDPANPYSGFNANFHNPYGRYFNAWMNYRF